MLEKYYGKTDFYSYIGVITGAVKYYREMKFHLVAYCNTRVFDAKQVISKQQSRPNINYYPFIKEQLLAAGEPGFVDRNSSYIGFVNFIVNTYEISREAARILFPA